MSHIVCNLMPQHCCQSLLALAHIKYAREDEYLAAWNDEGVLLLVLDDMDFPIVGFCREPRVRNQTIQNALYEFVLRM